MGTQVDGQSAPSFWGKAAGFMGGPGAGLAQMFLSPLFGKLLAGGGPNYENLIRMMQQNYGPGAVMKDAQKYYTMGLASPGFQNQLQGINLAGNQFNQNYAAGQASQGFGGDSVRSGLGQVGSAAAPGLSSIHRGQAYGGLWDNSQKQAYEGLMEQMKMLAGLKPAQGSGDLASQIFGGGASALGNWLKLKALAGQTKPTAGGGTASPTGPLAPPTGSWPPGYGASNLYQYQPTQR